MLQLPAVCNQCNDEINLVTKETGVSVSFSLLQNVKLTVALHDNECAQKWCSEFGVSLPGITSWASRSAKA
jgi:hypothetical protein